MSTPSVACNQAIMRIKATVVLAATLLAIGCQVEEKGSSDPAVATVNSKYNRLHSHVLIRRIRIPTEGNLDFAAYSKNVMLVDPEPYEIHPSQKIGLSALNFSGHLAEVKATLDFTSLTDQERKNPLAWTPIMEHLLKWNFEKTSKLANAYSMISGERWGDTSDVALPYQEFGSVYIHKQGNLKEVWIELEFKPWLKDFLDGIVDQDHDGFPEVMVRLDSRLFTPEMVAEITGDYFTKVLQEPEVMDWARNLASRWYPSFNTDLLELIPGSVWPYEATPLNVKEELAGEWVANPLFILKGRPFEDTLFNVFVVDGMGQVKTQTQARVEGKVIGAGIDKGLTKRLDAITVGIDSELEKYGEGKWPAWEQRLIPFQKDVRAFGLAEPSAVQGLVAKSNTLIFRRELDYLLAGDLERPEAAQHPVAVIAAFKDSLAQLGIDFLFVPIPTKLDIYPELISDSADTLPGHIAQPHFRKLIRDLAEARVETVDLLGPFLNIKAASEKGMRVLYQRQDTHWTTVGLETAAQLLAERIRLYTWYDAAFRDKLDYRLRDSVFENLGDIQARLSDAEKAKVPPEKILGRQVILPDGTPYEDSESSSILVLGDSYTGVFESVGCRHAGVTAHLAKGLGAPVDLIMGWGGGPEAPGKLKKRGPEYLQNKRLVVWMMSVRDVFVYPGEWAVK